MTRCDFRWEAPYLHAPPSTRVSLLEQECSLERGHDGPHRSLTNCIAPRTRDIRVGPLQPPAAPLTPDIRVQCEGTIFLVRGLTPRGTDWINEHLDPDGMTWGRSRVVEHRYITDIVNGALNAGLRVEGR